MTLFRQIYALLFGLFLLVVISLGYVQFTETKSFLEKQMTSDINNASHSLGLMLVPALEAGDLAQAETLINVIFEGGFYQQVKLKWLVDGKEQVWQNPVEIQGVPQWFVDLNLFRPISLESTVTSGWLQLATLEITAHPGFGYHELWRILQNAIILFSILFLIAIFSARFGLSFLLKPLHGLAEHSKSMEKQQFGPDIPLPKTKELQDVVKAFNSMSSKLSKVFNTLDQEVSNLRERNLIDNVSGLPNRQYMMSRLDSWLAEPGSGAVILAKLDWLETVHSKYGYQVRDETIRILARTLEHELKGDAQSVVTRIAAFEFAFLVSDVDSGKLAHYLQTLIRVMNQEITKAGGKANQEIVMGVAERIEGMKTSDILAQSDNALQQAIQQGKTYVLLAADQKQSLNREQWREQLTNAITNKQFRFRWQSIHSVVNQKVLHREVYSQLEIDDELVHAGQFMPYIEMLSLGSRLDKYLIDSIIEHDVLSQSAEPLAINLTLQSIRDKEFHAWLKQRLSKVFGKHKLCFEVPEAAVYSDMTSCIKLCELIQQSGARVGIDHFGRQLGSMTYLQNIHPDYVKLDMSVTTSLTEQEGREMCRALVNVAKGIDTEIIVTAIENEEQLQLFSEFDIDGYQGFIHPPCEIK
ncbi:EAL domain-containing protein [Shewanella sp. 202IG2-18]|uniref:bifunctional diguanylate cyclase/phosphodiesterase n=1 Tax=Parashewanella hymeniacidonis TaxID=2807618 RepID=UPI0019610611|nr:EAL domain-containing protein [Parashewanella hymeniacidonis]MBM7071238.1 EAL domain-containing protein [Parashewanella hymeniacidonis]